MVDLFIGSTFGEHNQLLVVGRYERGRKAIEYQLTCSICEKDELNVGEVYISNKANLLNGHLPCFCSGQKRRTEEQQTRRLKKECARREMEFLGYVGEYKNVDSLLKLRCLKDGQEWDTCSIDRLFNGGSCPKCTKPPKMLSDDEAIKCFMATGSFVEGTRFWFHPTPKRTKQWAYTCPVCSVDEYVQAGLCSGVFTADKAGLLAGSLSCRCSGVYRYTAEQKEYQISKKIKEENLPYKFLGWKSEWRGAKTNPHLYCEEHEDFFPSLTSFLYSGSRCPGCAVSGFKRHEDAFVYVLYVEGTTGNFTGYGITGNAKQRLMEHRASLSKEGFKITEYQTFPLSGNEALRVEGAVKGNFPCCPQAVKGFKTEATEAHLYSNVIEFVKSSISSTLQ